MRPRAGAADGAAHAFVTLMRAAGIPSRVVTGYHGGEWNPIGEYLIVRQADALIEGYRPGVIVAILGYAFWAVGELLGLEFFGCFILSSVGSIAGVWLGWRVAQHFK